MTNFINNPNPTNQIRFPEARVISNGDTLLPIEFNVKVSNNLTASTIEITFGLTDPTHDIAWWQALTTLPVDVQVAFEAPDTAPNYVSILKGIIDEFDIDTWNQTVTCHGRDQTSYFIDTKIVSSYQNMKSSDIVTLLAQGHGMQAVVDPTETLVGRYYQQNHSNNANNGQFSKSTTEWDFMCFLAQQEGYDLSVDGNIVYFKKQVDATDPSTADGIWGVNAPQQNIVSDRISIWESGNDINSLRIHRSLTLAKDIKVIVTGWHSKNGKSFQAIAERKKSGGKPTGSDGVQQYVFHERNITQAQAQAKANALLDDLSKHEFKLSWHEAGDVRLKPRCLIQLMGTNSGFDIFYYIDTIDFHFDIEAGFGMDVSAKNHDTKNQTTE